MEKIVDSCQVNKSFKLMKWAPKSHEPKKFKACWSQCCLEATMGQWWQWPVVSLGSSLLNVPVYCWLLILSHNSVGVWGVSNVHTVLIISSQSHPRHSSACRPPTSCPPPPHPVSFFCNPLSYARSQSFSGLKTETAAPCPEGSALLSSTPTSFNTFCGF